MKSNQLLRFIFLLSSLVISQVISSRTFQDTINLQQNERYILKLDDYYDFTSSQIDFPIGLPEENIILPYKELGSQNEGSKIQSITSFQDSLSSKYLIGYNSVRNGVTNNYDIQIIYFHLEILQGVLTRTQLASFTLFSSASTKFFIEASFYSSSNGFISYYESELIQGTSHFSYIESKGLINTILKNIQYIDRHVTMQGRENNIYVIYVDDTAINLLKYQTGGDTLQKIDTYICDLSINDNIVVDTTNALLGYDYDDNILYSFFLNQNSDKLIVKQLVLPKFDSTYILQSLQRFKNNVILTLTDIFNKRGKVYLNLHYNKSGENNMISINNIRQSKLYFNQVPIFIDDDILVIYNINSFQMINIEKQQVIFQQNLDQTYSFDPNQYIGNKFMVDISKQDDQGKIKYLNYAALIQRPSMVIIGTNQSFQYTIHQSEQPFCLKIQIKINVTNELITKFTKKLINLQKIVPILTDKVYEVPVEKFIIGSNFQPKITVSSDYFIRYAYIKRVNELIQQSSVYVNNVKSVYQTDGLISTLIINQSGNFYSIFGANPKINGEYGDVALYASNLKPQSTIRTIDNYGSFILQSEETNTFTIYIPFIVSDEYLYYNTFAINCSKINFSFASDPSNNVLFVMCDQSITQIIYQYNNAKEGELFIISQNNLIFDASQYRKLICIKGHLFIYNDQYITAYDYQVNSFIGNPIQIPQFQENQQIILFSQTFIISYNNQQKINIQLFSYDQFQNQRKKAVFVRYLILDQPFQENLSLIPKRNQIEYLFVKAQDQYQLFRINNAYSQTQFYTTVVIESDSPNVPIISQDEICLVGSQQVKCQQILEQATLTFYFNTGQRDFNRFLTFQTLITLKIGDYSQTYDLSIMRNASTQYGIVNQNAQSIQKLKADLQKSNFDGRPIFFEDKDVFNACILGWQSANPNAWIVNRLGNEDTKIKSYVFTILYNQKAILESNQIKIGNNLLIIQGDFSQDCFTILDDSASKVQINPSSFNQDIYVLCKARLSKYNLQFTSDKNGVISQASLIDQNSQSFDASNQQNHFRRIVSIDSELWLFDPTWFNKYLIKKQEGSEQLSVSRQYISLTSILSFNVISNLNLKLSFFRSGLINVESVQDSDEIQYSYYYLQDLLKSNNFIVGENDLIASIYQYSDNQFRIQYTYSFIYDITFSLDKNQQLIIDSVQLYYYKDAFDQLQAGIKGDQYTLLFGQKYGQTYIATYTNQNVIQEQYLIQNAEAIYQKSIILDSATITYAQQISQNQFIIYFTNGSSTSITVRDRVAIVIPYQQFNKNQVTIHPYKLIDEKYQINFSISNNNPSPPPSPSPSPSLSSQTIIWFSMSILFLQNLLIL